MIKNVHEHTMNVTDLQLAPDRTYFITASKDKTAKVSFIGEIILTVRYGTLLTSTSLKHMFPIPLSTQQPSLLLKTSYIHIRYIS